MAQYISGYYTGNDSTEKAKKGGPYEVITEYRFISIGFTPKIVILFNPRYADTSSSKMEPISIDTNHNPDHILGYSGLLYTISNIMIISNNGFSVRNESHYSNPYCWGIQLNTNSTDYYYLAIG